MTIIDAINETATALANLSKALAAMEEAKKLATLEPETMEKQLKVIEKQEPAPDAESSLANFSEKLAEGDVTLEQIRAVLAEKTQAGLTEQVRTLLERFGANKLSAVKPEDYANLMTAAKEI